MSKANIMDMKAGSIVGRRERPVGVLSQAETRRADTGQSAHYDPHDQRGADVSSGASPRPVTHGTKDS
jgi:hypothetical protein